MKFGLEKYDLSSIENTVEFDCKIKEKGVFENDEKSNEKSNEKTTS